MSRRQQPRPRTTTTYVGFREPFRGLKLEEGRARVLRGSGEWRNADAEFVETTYLRDNGTPKVVTRVPDTVALDVARHLASFDKVYAIDTNTKSVGNDAISVASAIECRPIVISEARIVFELWRLPRILFRNCAVNYAERFGWNALFNLAPIISSSLQRGIL